jgi:hypothetical protein
VSEHGAGSHLKNSLSIASRGEKGSGALLKNCHLLPFWCRETPTLVLTVPFLRRQRTRRPRSFVTAAKDARCALIGLAGFAVGRDRVLSESYRGRKTSAKPSHCHAILAGNAVQVLRIRVSFASGKHPEFNQCEYDDFIGDIRAANIFARMTTGRR